MRLRSTLGLFSLCAALVMPTCVWAAADADNTFETKLANGMRVVVREDHRAPTAVQMVWYRVGSIDERDGVTGVAHVTEHMMF